jgi:hypothetical protein
MTEQARTAERDGVDVPHSHSMRFAHVQARPSSVIIAFDDFVWRLPAASGPASFGAGNHCYSDGSADRAAGRMRAGRPRRRGLS